MTDHLCKKCKKRPATIGKRGGKTMCDRCREARDRYWRKAYAKNKEPYLYRNYSDEKKEKHKALVRANRERAIERGLCTHCRKPATMGRNGKQTYCDACRIKYRDIQRERKRRAAINAQDMA